MRNRWASPQLRIWMRNPRVYVITFDNDRYFTDLHSISLSEVREVSLPHVEVPKSVYISLLLDKIHIHAMKLAEEGVIILERGEPADYLN